ncbi:MAG TPA: chitobiase/beta-hexosaminidase C-terminal domain-containing protein [Armatimonadota bacterium]|jgi:hypothetical protein
MFTRFARRSVLPLILLLSLAPLSRAAVLRVTKAGSATPDGQTWATAYGSVQATINAAAAGDEVWVAAGTYVENITLKDGVSLYGGFAGTETARAQRDWTANESILDGNQTGSVIAGSGTSVTTAVDGFTIQNGVAVGADHNVGGGIYVSGAATISNNTITSNLAVNGGGVGLLGWAVITSNTISDNEAINGGGGISMGAQEHGLPQAVFENNAVRGNRSQAGGGAYVSGGDLPTLVKGNHFTDNYAGRLAGGGFFDHDVLEDNAFSGNSAGAEALQHPITGHYGGGGLYAFNSVVHRNTIIGNSAYRWGAGVSADNGSLVEANLIASNRAAPGSGNALRIAIGAIARSNVIVKNESDGGTAVLLDEGDCTLVNNTIVGNTAHEGSLGESIVDVAPNDSTQVIANNIIVGNDNGIRAPGTARYRNNLVSGNLYFNYYTPGSWHQSDLTAAPTFVNAAADDYRLTIDSVGIDAGYDAPLTADALDFAGNPRRQGEHSDLGAYEYAAVADIAMTPARGTFLPPLDIALSCPTPDAPIHYTLNGAAPTASDPVVPASGKITLNAWAMVKARAFKAGIVPSATAVGGFQVGQLWFDTAKALRIAAGLDAAAPGDLASLNAAGGNGINLLDAVALARKAAGLDP